MSATATASKMFVTTKVVLKVYLLENDNEFTRKSRTGDYKIVHQQKLKKGYLEKFYPPLHEMGDFSELLAKLSPNVQKS